MPPDDPRILELRRMHALGANTAGQFGSATAGGMLLALVSGVPL